jgi:hypothetical protein
VRFLPGAFFVVVWGSIGTNIPGIPHLALHPATTKAALPVAVNAPYVLNA